MNEPLRVLLIEDSEDDAVLIMRELRKCDAEIRHMRVDTEAALRNALAAESWDIVLSDYSMPQFTGLAALEIVRESGLELPFVIVSGTIGEETAVQFMRAGANDYVWKDKLGRLVAVVKRALNDAAIRRERREAERALKKALEEADAERSKIKDIIKSVPDGLMVCDERNNVVLMNAVALDLLGLPDNEVLNQPLSQVFEDSYLRSQLRTLLDPETPERHELDLRLPLPGSKYPRIIHARTSVMINRAGASLGTVTILRDMTRERELDRMKNEFISTAAHELSTPLTTVIGYAEILLSPDRFGDFGEEERRTFLEEIYEKSNVLATIVEELLDISRIESGQGMTLKMGPCDLRKTIGKVVQHFQLQVLTHTFEMDLSEELPSSMLLDEMKLDAVLENLLSNAVKYSPRGGHIRITGNMAEGQFVCSVSDEGLGMTPEQTQRVFDKFYRVDASNTAVQGLGLGLSIARQIVEHHGGKIWLESEPGKGTTANFTLPVCRGEANGGAETGNADLSVSQTPHSPR
jgi:PAS domain S-box-containing protein